MLYSMYPYFVLFYSHIFHCMDIYIPHFVYPLISWWTNLSWFPFLDTMNNVAVNIHVHILCRHMCSVHLVLYLGVELLSRMITLFNVWRNCQTFPKWVQSHQQCKKVPSSPHPHQHLLLSCCLFYLSHLGGCEVGSHCDFNLHFPND